MQNVVTRFHYPVFMSKKAIFTPNIICLEVGKHFINVLNNIVSFCTFYISFIIQNLMRVAGQSLQQGTSVDDRGM